MTETMTTWIKELRALDACPEAIRWAVSYPTFEAAWTACQRGDWLLWYAGRISGPPESVSRKRLVLAACLCAREVLPIYETRHPEDARPRTAIDTAERWARSEAGVTLADVRRAAAYAGADPAAGAAAYAAASAASSAASSAAAAAASADAAYAYASSAAYAAAYAARTAMLTRCADLVRTIYPTPPTRAEAV